jgi:hypothetical protein
MSLLRFQPRQGGGAIFGTFLILLTVFSRSLTLQAQQSDTTIVFYAESKVSDDLWPELFRVLRSDLADGAGESPNGFGLDRQAAFVRASDNLTGILFSKVIVVKLLGRCDLLPRAGRRSLSGPLGWVHQVSGTIQPFVFVDCTRLAELLRPIATSFDKQGRQHVMDQAIAHVLIHEWSHIETQSTGHSSHGITQACLSVNELIAEPKNNDLPAANR